MNALHTHMYKDSHYNALYPNRSQVSILIEQSDCFHHGAGAALILPAMMQFLMPFQAYHLYSNQSNHLRFFPIVSPFMVSRSP